VTKIAFFLPDLRTGGAEHVMTIIASAISQRGYLVDFVLVKARGEYLKSLDPQVRIIDLNCSSTYWSLGQLSRYFRDAKPDILLSALDLTNMVAIIAKKFAKYPKKHFIRLANTQSALTRSPIKKFFEKWLIKLLYPQTEGIIAVSDAVSEDFRAYSGIEGTPIKTIYNPVITDDLLIKAQEDLNHPWFDPKEVPVILSVGRLSEQKNFALLIRAFANLLKNTPARLMILGEGHLREDLVKLCMDLNIQDHVQFPGVVSNPYKFMRNADLFVLSSNYEGLPNALVEALACGCAIVSTDCLSGPREILDHGKYGRLVPVGDATALSEAMRETLVSGAKLLNEGWLDQFKAENVVDQYLAFMGLSSRSGEKHQFSAGEATINDLETIKRRQG